MANITMTSLPITEPGEAERVAALTEAQRKANLERVMMAMARAHDNTVSEREKGAVLALRCGNGMATHYWRKVAQAALRAILITEKEPRT